MFFLFVVFKNICIISVVFVSLGSTKKDFKPLDVITGSPKHRTSIAATSSLSVEVTTENDSDSGGAVGQHYITHQSSFDHSMTLKTSVSAPCTNEPIEMDISAETLEKILENKLVREKRLEMEKKLESLRKKHDKEKLRVTSHKSGDLTDGIRKSKFYMGNKLVKRLSSKNIDVPMQIPPCPMDLTEVSDVECSTTTGGSVGVVGIAGDKPPVTRSQSERLLMVCREYSASYREIQEKYHEAIYSTADKLLRTSQTNQMKQLRVGVSLLLFRFGC